MNTRRNTPVLARFGLALAIAAAAGSAMVPATASARQQSVDTYNSQTTWTDTGDSVKVSTRDGKTEITVNGRTLPEGATSYTDEKSGITVTREGGQVIVTRKGEVVLRHSEKPAPPRALLRGLGGNSDAPSVRGWSQRVPGGRDVTIEVVHPKVMIGVTMDSIERDGRTATVLQRILDDLPADRAGLEAGDVITQVNGAKSSSPEDIRGAIRELEPGDTLRLTIERNGSPREVELKVEAFDPSKLESPQAWALRERDPGAGLFFFDTEEARRDLETLRQEMAALTAELTARAQSLANAAAEDAQDLTAQIAELTSELAAKSAELTERAGAMAGPHVQRLQGLLRQQWESLPNLRFESDDGAMRGLVVPAPSAPTTPGTPGSPDAIDDRLERLNDRLDRLEGLLEQLLEERTNDERR